MSEVASSSRPPSPKCRICLETYTNCFLYSCMHEFCFTCIMEGLKVNAECPLCKKPFKYVINNIKSNDEYDKYFITSESPEDSEFLEVEESLPPTPPRCFTFRSHKDYKSRRKEKSKSQMKTIIVSDSSSSDIELLSSRKRKMDFDSDDDTPSSKIKSKKPKKELKKNCSSSQTISSRTHTITSRDLLSSGEVNQPDNATEYQEEYWNDGNCGFSHRDYSGHNWEDKNKILEVNYSSYCAGPSTSRGVIVKKEEKENFNIYHCYRDYSGYNWDDKNVIGEADYNSYYSGPSTSHDVKENTNTNHYYLNADTSDSDD